MSILPPNLSRRYTIDHDGLTSAVLLGYPNRHWNAMEASVLLHEYMERPEFDLERICARCHSHDVALGLQPHQLRLPKLRAREMIQIRDLLPLPWEGAHRVEEAKLKPYHVERPGLAADTHGCHMCLFSFLDPVPPPELSEEEVEALKADFQDARAEVSRLHQARARETRANVLAYIEGLLQKANARLTIATHRCRDAGFEPFRRKAVREGDEAPDQVGATEWEVEGWDGEPDAA